MSAPRFVVGAALRVHVVDAARWNDRRGLARAIDYAHANAPAG